LNRRSFIIKSGLGALAATAVPELLFAAGSNSNSPKLKLLEEMSIFMSDQLKMNLARNFYKKWTDDGFQWHYVIYFSESHKICPAVYDRGYGFVHKNEVKETVEKFSPSGFHSMVYKTVGTARAQLSNRLLSYAPADLAFVAFHEGMHQHFRRRRRNQLPPLEMEEAASDVLGNYGALQFLQLHRKDFAPAKEQAIMYKEKLAEIINRFYWKVNERLPDKKTGHLYLRCQREIRNTIQTDQLFNLDRYLYPVNNAYLLRFSRYCLCYFILKEMLIEYNYEFGRWIEDVKYVRGSRVEECLELIERIG